MAALIGDIALEVMICGSSACFRNAYLQGSSFIVFPEFSLLPPSSSLHPFPFSLCRDNKTAFAEFCESLPVASPWSDGLAFCDNSSMSAPLSILSCASKMHPSATISYNTCEASENGRLYNTQVHSMSVSATDSVNAWRSLVLTMSL
jgi:hypothetical protein